MDTLTVIALVVLIVVAGVLLVSRRRDAARSDHPVSRSPSGSLEHRVALHVAQLASPRAEEAERGLLSMGAPVIPHLLHQLERIDIDPLAITPKQQLAVERLLADFGPRTFVQTHRFLRRVHRVSPIFPSVVRILTQVGPSLILDLRSASDQVPFSLLAPLVSHLGTEVAVDDWVDVLADVDDGGALLVASLPLVVAHPPALERLLALAALHPDRIGSVLARTPLGVPPASPPPAAPTPLAPGSLGTVLDTLDSTEDEEAFERLLLQLTPHLDDPRVHERFLRLVEESARSAALALRELARAGTRSLQPLLNRTLRQPHLDARDIERLRDALRLRPEPCLQTLTVAMRSETPRVVLRAVAVMSAVPVSDHLLSFLKALGRHRYSPLEASLAAPILASWDDAMVSDMLAAARHADREVQVSAVELIGFYGDARHVGALLALWGEFDYLDDVILNALELIGVAALPALRRRLDDDPAAADASAMKRRTRLLQAIADAEGLPLA